jgi:hypothetical protein
MVSATGASSASAKCPSGWQATGVESLDMQRFAPLATSKSAPKNSVIIARAKKLKDRECKSVDVVLGRYGSLDACTQACAQVPGCLFFSYRANSDDEDGGMCKQELTSSAECIEGEDASAIFKFYQVVRTAEVVEDLFISQKSTANYAKYNPTSDNKELSQVSMSMWFKTDNKDTALFSWSDTNSKDALSLVINEVGELEVFVGGSSALRNIDDNMGSSISQVVNDNKWHHVCISQSSTPADGAMYVDGNREGSWSSNYKVKQSGGIAIGQRQTSKNGNFAALEKDDAFTGSITGFHIYFNALTQDACRDSALLGSHSNADLQFVHFLSSATGVINRESPSKAPRRLVDDASFSSTAMQQQSFTTNGAVIW